MDRDESRSHTHRYEIYVEGAHVFVRDGQGHSLDIGLVTDDGDRLSYQLDVEGLWGEGFLTSEKLLQDVAAKLAYAPMHKLFCDLPPSSAQVRSAPSDSVIAIDIEDPGTDPPPGSAAQ